MHVRRDSGCLIRYGIPGIFRRICWYSGDVPWLSVAYTDYVFEIFLVASIIIPPSGSSRLETGHCRPI